MALIQFTGLTKRYRDVTAVDDLTFTLAPGRVTGFVGANGAGKTTTIRALLGLTRPSAGTVTIDGLPYARARPTRCGSSAPWSTRTCSTRVAPPATPCGSSPAPPTSPTAGSTTS